MLNNTAKAEIDIIFFNRLEKVGSQSMSQLLRTLSRIHKFTYNIKVRNVGQILDTIEEQRDLAEEILDYGIPNAFTMHRNFINFTDLDLPKPIYINLVRHPIEKVKSAYYYLRHPFIYNNMLLRNPSKPTKKYEFFNLSFNDCVREGKIPDCIFEPHTQFNSDWRRFAMHFCGNQPVCKYLYTLYPDLLNNTKKAEIDILFFNRLEKVGSQSLSVLLNTLSKENNFVPYRNSAAAQFHPNLVDVENQRQTVEELIGENVALSYVEHMNWINFTEFGQPKPIYINLVRHPIEKVVSAYYYIRHPAVFAYYVQNGHPMEDKAYFDTNFNDCVREKRKECTFDSHNPYNADWRRFAMHFCGNFEIC
ncbi:PREDICTED: heparan sulfate 2-O-sulfotransferase hst-2-like, partial [Rhagoletis zephyria]|uniref:heparan sulfate 2-O-sulfotransferase hst-2-like n=1 Tax=Rhagoletis zephyria TaxID=28612 RepID=UPI000811584E